MNLKKTSLMSSNTELLPETTSTVVHENGKAYTMFNSPIWGTLKFEHSELLDKINNHLGVPQSTKLKEINDNLLTINKL